MMNDGAAKRMCSVRNPLGIVVLTGLLCAFSGLAAARDAEDPQPDVRMQWWRQARFGMFVHWGLYSELGGRYGDWRVGFRGLAEWIMDNAQIPVQEYQTLADRFNPAHFDADQWVRLARDTGMKYLVMTAKHHDGFCLWPTDTGDYDIMRTPFQRDVLGELAAACKKYDVRLCFYYSIMDWHHPDYLPRRKWEKRSAEGADFERYIAIMKAQLKELITRYDPAVLWFDGEWDDTWTSAMGKELYRYVRSLKPDILINNRVDKGREGMTGTFDPSQFAGDFGTPEQEVPDIGLDYDWETCMTINHTWGYSQDDHAWKTIESLLRQLVDTASKGGNYLLNIGPKADGTVPRLSVVRLEGIGRWMKANGESIYGTTASPFGDLGWGRCTQKTDGKDTVLYLHVFFWPTDQTLVVPGLQNEVLSASLLASGKPLSYTRRGGDIDLHLPQTAPEPTITVIKLKIAGHPAVN